MCSGQSYISKVNYTHEITGDKVLNVKLIMWWDLQHQAVACVSQPLITYVVNALTQELSAPMAHGPCSVLGYVNDMAAQRNCLL